MVTSWRDLLGERRNLVRLAFIIGGLFITLYANSRFLALVEQRQGIAFIDPVHVLVGPVDLTWPTMCILYGALILATAFMLRYPLVFLAAVQAVTIQVVVRMMMIWSLPLDPAPTMIPLVDPVMRLVNSSVGLGARDLFYSGHVAVLVIISMLAPSRWLRWLLVAAAIAVGIGLIIQHVHYTVDVLVAPFIAMACVRFVARST